MAQFESVPVLPDAHDLRLLVVLNPYSSNYPKARAQFEHIRSLGFAGTQDWIETTGSWHDLLPQLGDKLTAGHNAYHAVMPITGDGGTNEVTQSIYRSGDERVLATPLAAGRGGGAGDIHAMTLGRDRQRQGDYIAALPGAPIRQVRPIDITVTDTQNGQQRHEAALAYFSIGTLGSIALALNGEKHRNSPLLGKRLLHELQEVATGIRALANIRRFESADRRDHDTGLLGDIVVMNGDTMGRRRFFPGELFEPGYHQLTARHIGELLVQFGHLKRGSDKVMQRRTESSFVVSPKRGDINNPRRAIQAQFDGETFPISWPTVVDIATSSTTIRMVSAAAPHESLAPTR